MKTIYKRKRKRNMKKFSIKKQAIVALPLAITGLMIGGGIATFADEPTPPQQ